MSRLLLCGVLSALLPLPVQAEQTVTPTEMLIRLTVSPMAAPKPALRYLLLPELKELNPGNPIPNYLKIFMDSDGITASGLRQADRAARLDKPDWQILEKLKTDGVYLLLPDVQKVRALSTGLKKRFHTEIAQNRLDDALVTAKTMFALSRHTGEHPTIIGDLVAIAMAFVAISPFEDMLERPGCPNFYWALTNLPSPFISLEKGFEGERIVIYWEFNDLRDDAPMTAEQIKKVIVRIAKYRELGVDFGKTEGEIRAILDNRAKDAAYMSAARKRLEEFGIPAKLREQFPIDQIILLDERCEADSRRDDMMKLMKLPIWQAEELMAKIKPHNQDTLFDFLLPVQRRVFRAQIRLEQRIAMLRHVEALRIFAAEHDGKLPEKLGDFTVPLPNDPVTGKPFRFSVEGDTVHFRGTAPVNTEKEPAHNVHFEVKIRGKSEREQTFQSIEKK